MTIFGSVTFAAINDIQKIFLTSNTFQEGNDFLLISGYISE